MSKIIEVLHDNYKGCVEEEDQTMDKKDVQDCAVEMEYSVFTSNTTMTMYRNGVAKMVCLIFLFCDYFVIWVTNHVHQRHRLTNVLVLSS